MADDHPAVVDQTDMGIDLTPPEKITDQLPIVARAVVQITDRPDEVGSAAGASGGAGTLLADEPADRTEPVPTVNNLVDRQSAPYVDAHDHDDRRSVLDGDVDDLDDVDDMVDQPAAIESRRRVMWGILGALVTAALAAGVYFGAQRYNDSLFHVTVDNGELVINQGREGGLLWLDPVEVERTQIFFDDLTDASQATFDSWDNFTSRRDAQLGVDNLDVQREDQSVATGSNDDAGAEDDGGTTTTQDG